MIFATWQVGQLFWSMLWLALFFMLIWVVIAVFTDLFRSDRSGWAKALWTVFIVFLPWLGVFVYMVMYGGSIGDSRYVGGYPEGGAWGYGPPATYGPVVAGRAPVSGAQQ